MLQIITAMLGIGKGNNMKANASLSVELNVECPNPECPNCFDLFNCQELIDDGFLYGLVFSKDNSWRFGDFQKQLDDYGVEIHCPNCNTKIEIESVENG